MEKIKKQRNMIFSTNPSSAESILKWKLSLCGELHNRINVNGSVATPIINVPPKQRPSNNNNKMVLRTTIGDRHFIFLLESNLPKTDINRKSFHNFYVNV